MKKKCMSGVIEEVLMMQCKGVCTATHPSTPNFSGHSRGRKIHLAKDDKLTVCNMLIDQYVPKSDTNWMPVLNGKCKVCFKQKAL